MNDGYTQFRLSNGDEIVAQVVHEPEGDEANIVVRNALMIIRTENVIEGFRYYSFRPWMSYQLNDEYYQLLNYGHIVGEAKPDSTLLEQYHKAIEIEKESHPNNSDPEKKQEREYLRTLMEQLDSDAPSNVITFSRGRDRLH